MDILRRIGFGLNYLAWMVTVVLFYLMLALPCGMMGVIFLELVFGMTPDAMRNAGLHNVTMVQGTLLGIIGAPLAMLLMKGTGIMLPPIYTPSPPKETRPKATVLPFRKPV